MSSVSSSFKNVPRLQYITSQKFNKNIFQYSTYIDSSLATRGRLINHPNATELNCVAGIILRENGKKLHGQTHPDLKDPVTGLQYTYLVGVYDVFSGINGFINPNAPYFAVLNTDKSYQDDITSYQLDASRQNDTGVINPPFNYNNTGNTILGPPVNTGGDISTRGYITGSQLHGVDLIHTIGYIVAAPTSLIVDSVTGATISYSNYTILAQSNITSLANIYASNGVVHGSNLTAMSNITAGRNIDASNGVVHGSNLTALSNITAGRNIDASNGTITARKFLTNPVGSGVGSVGTPLTGSAGRANLGGSGYSTVVYTTQVTSSSMVFVTVNNASGTGGSTGARKVSVVPADGSFTVYTDVDNDNSTFYWLVIN
jgi:hypothetical protein